MKKFLLFLLTLSITVLFFASCGTGDTPPETAAPTAPEETQPQNPLSTVSPAAIVKALCPDSESFVCAAGCWETVLDGVSRDVVVQAFAEEDFTELDYATYIEGAQLETIVLTRAHHTVTLYCSGVKNEVRVMWEDAANREPLKPTKETGTGVITVAQVGIERTSENDNPLNGMCYVIKLSNGNAMIIDGGFNTGKCAANIMNTLEKLEIAKAGNKYVIEAWIFTHGHGDHVGAFQKFSADYAAKATVENIILSYPPADLIADGPTTFSRGNFSSARILTPHAGLKYYFGNATVSMLYTPELLYSADGKVIYFNDTSLVFKVSVGETEVMFFGDAGDYAAYALVASYDAAAFQSDIFQVTHHGLYTRPNGHTWVSLRKLYGMIDADYAFLPMHSRYAQDARNGRYTVLIKWASTNYQTSFVVNRSDNHGLRLSQITQKYYTSFVDSVADGTAAKPTLFGYNGINQIVNQDGLVTYLGGSETEPMVTIFELDGTVVTLQVNEPLHTWLGK